MSLRLTILAFLVLSALATTADDDNQVQLGDTKFRITPPPADTWEKGEKPAGPNALVFLTKKHDAVMAIQLLPADMEISPEVTDALIKQLAETRKKAKSKMLLEPTAEADSRFALKIHERYEVKEGKVSDQLHIYRYIDKRVGLTVVNVLSDDSAMVKTYQTAAEDAMASTTWPGMKRQTPPASGKPTTRPSTRPIGKPLTRPARVTPS